MSNKDFLSQFSGDNQKPDSFKEEERVKVEKNRNPINVKLLLIILAVAIVVVGVVLFFVFRPTIEVKDFVGAKSTDVASWIRQNDIETSGVVFKEEYSFDYGKDTIISQSVEAGTKIRKDAKLDFVVSLGANPEENVDVPNLKVMTKDEIQSWIIENQLSKTKVMSTYNENVPEGEVINIEFKNADETSFTRASTLTITVSKGPKPADIIEVPDFVKKHYSEVETWAKNNKIELTQATSFSDKIDKDYVISQSIDPKKEIKQGDTFSIVVSKGKGITIPNLKAFSKTDVEEYIKENSAFIIRKEMYSNTSDYVISQSVPGGSVVSTDNKVTVVINLGSSVYLKDLGLDRIVGMRIQEVEDALNNAREKGVDGYVGCWANPEGVYSENYYAGQIVSVRAEDSKGNIYDVNNRMPLDIRLNVVVSKGLEFTLSWVETNHTLEEEAQETSDGITSGLVLENGKFITSRLADIFASKNFTFQNNSVGDICDLYLNGYKVDTKSYNEVIVRQDMYIEFK